MKSIFIIAITNADFYFSVSKPNFSKVFLKRKNVFGPEGWEYFSKATEDAGCVKCSLCYLFLQYKDSSTSTMKKHLAGRHEININSKNNRTESSSRSSTRKR